jgi:hypothetical protein
MTATAQAMSKGLDTTQNFLTPDDKRNKAQMMFTPIVAAK